MLKRVVASALGRVIVVTVTATTIVAVIGVWGYSTEADAILDTSAPAAVTAGWLQTEKTRWIDASLAVLASAALCGAALEWRHSATSVAARLTSTVTVVLLLSFAAMSVMYVASLPELRWMEKNGCCTHTRPLARHAGLLAGGPALLLGAFLRKQSHRGRRGRPEPSDHA
jgi:hypothetical protein